MSPDNFVNSLGLVLDIIGVLLVWIFGLTKLLTIEGEILTVDYADRRQDRRIRRQHRVGRMGMLLIVLGFILQLVSNFV